MLLAESCFVALVLVEVLLRLTTGSTPPLEERRFAVIAPGSDVANLVRQIPVVDHGLPPSSTLRLLYDAAGAPGHPYLVTDGSWQYLDAPINAHGFRGALPDLPKQRPRIACVGDSFTFGDGVPEGDSWVALLDTAFPGQELLNYGVPGLDLAQIAQQFEARVAADEPDRVLYAMTLNDVPGSGSDEQLELAAEARTAFRRTLEGPRGLARFSRLAAMVQDRARESSKGAHFEESVRASFDPESDGWAAWCAELERLDRETRAVGAELTLVLFPLMVQLDGGYPFEELHERVGAACDERGIAFLDLLPAYRGESAKHLWVHPTDQHPNPAGHTIAAEAIGVLLGTE